MHEIRLVVTTNLYQPCPQVYNDVPVERRLRGGVVVESSSSRHPDERVVCLSCSSEHWPQSSATAAAADQSRSSTASTNYAQFLLSRLHQESKRTKWSFS